MLFTGGLTGDNEISTPMLIGQIEESGGFESSGQMFSSLINKHRLTARSQTKVAKLPLEIAVMKQILRFLQLLCENHNPDLQNFLRNQNQKTNFNLVSETLIFLDRICGSTTGGLGLLGLYINESNVALVNQTLETLTEYCQGPCHENQNCIATHESNGIDIIIALILNDINPLGRKRMDLVLELKNNASKLLLAIMESRADSENAERILYNMSPKQLLEVACRAFHQKPTAVPQTEAMPNAPVTPTTPHHRAINSHHHHPLTLHHIDDPPVNNNNGHLGDPKMPPESSSTFCRRANGSIVDPKEVGHNIYILCHQLAQHNKELADLLRNPDSDKSEQIFESHGKVREALQYYQTHTAQIEIVRFDRTMEQIVFPVPQICEFLTSESKGKVYYNAERDEQGSKVFEFFERADDLFNEMNWQKRLRGRLLLKNRTIVELLDAINLQCFSLSQSNHFSTGCPDTCHCGTASPFTLPLWSTSSWPFSIRFPTKLVSECK